MLATKPSASRRVMDILRQLGVITHLSTTGEEAQVKLVPDRLVNSIGTVGMGVGAALGGIVGGAVGRGVGLKDGGVVGMGEGGKVGDAVGRGVGGGVGDAVGRGEGRGVGDAVGRGVGTRHADAPASEPVPVGHDGQLDTLPRE